VRLDLRRFAGRFAALGHEMRLEILRQLLAAHPQGMVAREIRQELNLAPSTLSHHLYALLQAQLIQQHREGRSLRYRADAGSLRELLDFLHAECCIRNDVLQLSTPVRRASS
jgi:ArsR family transcriptional regulator